MTDIYLKGLIEEVLYVWAEPISIDEISKILYDYSKVDIKKSLEEMIKEREERQVISILSHFFQNQKKN